ncbi:probable transcription factor At1g11510 isoform X2 [Vigna radiata var. radiata]|uniref:Probable transcription factor At1g11510 isoform X2 n=1 Tax=Vigna radiata var. radiata TaxID=3916 RepID=A0A1S3VWZ5_VIGRR|nr:probable transcription factor At1g11510 isoform X2 [Vigna radiata var. radiata]
MTKKRKQRPESVEDLSTASSYESEEDDDRSHSSQQHAAAAQVSSSEKKDDSSDEEDEKQRSILPASSSESEEDDDQPHSSQQHAAAAAAQVSSSEEEDDSSDEEDEKQRSMLPASSSESEEDDDQPHSSQQHAAAAAAVQVSSSEKEDDSSDEGDEKQRSILPASSSEYEEDDDQPHSSQQHAAAAAQVSSSEEEDDSSDEEDEKQRSILPASANHPSKPHPKSSSESESDTGTEPARVKSKAKPTDLPQPKVQAQRSSTPVKLGSKRPAHSTEPKRTKKNPDEAPFPSVANDETSVVNDETSVANDVTSVANDETSVANDETSVANDETKEDGKKSDGQAKVLFQRIWSEEDELGILKGILEFISKTGQEPYRYVDAFHNFIKKSLHVEVSSLQLKDKIRRMKKKFETHEAKKKKGIEPRLLRPHDRALFEFSKKIWGEWPNGLVEKPKPLAKYVTKAQKESEAKAKVLSQPSVPESGDVNLLYNNISCFKELDEDEMKRGLTLIGESKRKELERRWKVLQYSEMELLGNRSLLIGEQIKLVSQALQSSND